MFSHALVEGQGKHEGIRAGVRDIVGIKQGRDLCFPAESLKTLSDIKNQVPAVTYRQSFGQGFDVADTICLVTQTPEGLFDGLNCVGTIEFCRFLQGVSCGKVIVTKVIGNPDL